MQYLALLFGEEGPSTTPGSDGFMAELAGYEAFGEHAGRAVVAGEALHPAVTAATIRPGSGSPLVTAGPYTEAAEVVGGFYVLEVETLDDAIDLARRIPIASRGGVELWPMVMFQADPEAGQGPDRWLALLLEHPDDAVEPGSPEWEVGAAEHGTFAAEVAPTGALIGGGALHPPGTATTVRVRGDEVLVTDGPFAESAEIANGFYLLRAASQDVAVTLAGRIPVSPRGAVEVRPVVDFSALADGTGPASPVQAPSS